jgi:esterase/lipase
MEKKEIRLLDDVRDYFRECKKTLSREEYEKQVSDYNDAILLQLEEVAEAFQRAAENVSALYAKTAKVQQWIDRG